LAETPDPNWYRRTLDNLLEGFQIIGFDWTYLYINPAAAEHGRRAPRDLEGRKIWDAYPGIKETPIFATLKTCMDERRHDALENVFTYPDGQQRWFELRIEPVPEGICVHSVDIQDRKTAQLALEIMNTTLTVQAADRLRELEQVNAELEAFAYSVSHDLRAPLRHIAGFASLLRARVGHTLDDRSTDFLTKVTEAAQRMGILIDELLAFSRTGRAPLHREPVDLGLVVRRVQRELAGEAAPVQWTIGDLPTVSGDPELLRLVIANLLSNAVKYSRTRTEPCVEIGSSPGPAGGEITVFIRDNGVGFDMAYVNKLFGVFQRLHRADEFEGTGIGLANVRRIIHKHGGRTWAEGALDRGATFYFSVPVEHV
jgi:PAS domain S-box-containing protein